MWIIFCIIIVLLLIALLGVIPTIKDNMHRPRFRFLIKDHLDTILQALRSSERVSSVSRIKAG